MDQDTIDRSHKKVHFICIGMVLVGIFLRTYHYLMSRSLWVDEAMVSLNVISSTFGELMRPLKYDQLKPIGFMFIEKIAVGFFGDSEYALRALPLVCGVLSITFFYSLVKKILRPGAVMISLGLFVFADQLIYYSSEVQPYSCDVFFAIFLVWLYQGINELNDSQLKIPALIISGIFSVWISLPSSFVLASIGLVGLHQSFQKKQKKYLIYLIFCGSAWLFSFIVHYIFLRRNILLGGRGAVIDAWFQRGFMPLSPTTLSDVRWYIDTFFNVFSDQPTRLFLPGLSAFCFIAGLISLRKDKPEAFFLFLLPVIGSLIASGFKLYPFCLRWIVFLVPFFIIFIGEGLHFFRSIIEPHSKALSIILIVLFFFKPVTCQIYRLINPYNGEEIKPVMQHIIENMGNDDQLYIYYSAEPAFMYYCKRYDLCRLPRMVGSDGRNDLSRYDDDLKKLKGKGRIWFVFSHVPDWLNFDEERFFLYLLDKMGNRLSEKKTHGAAAYLYNL